MFSLRNLRKRSEGLDFQKVYDPIITNFHCVHVSTPPEYEIGCPLLSCAFAKKTNFGHILAATCDNGRIVVMNTEKVEEECYPYHIQVVNSDALFSVVWSDVEMKLLTASGNHIVTLFDVEKNISVIELNSFKAHTRSVKTVCFKPLSSSVFASGGRDGSIYVWDARNFTKLGSCIQPEQSIMNCHIWTGSSVNSTPSRCENKGRITSLVFQNDNKLISCADTDSVIKVWDLRKTYMTYMNKPSPYLQFCPKMDKSIIGYSHMIINKNTTQIFANSLDNRIYCFNVSTHSASLDYVYIGHTCNSFYVKCSLSPTEKYLASTDSNNRVYIWRKGHNQTPIVALDGKYTGLSGVCWCPEDELKLATTSDHPSPWIWNALPDPPSKTPLKLGYAINLDMNIICMKKCNRISSMATNLSKYCDQQNNELSKIKLPNAITDGQFQTHTCEKNAPKRNVSGNWLTNFHHQQLKQPITPKQTKKLAVRNRVSPKTEKSPGVQSRVKQMKRKRLSMSPNSNILTKYFKTSDENRAL